MSVEYVKGDLLDFTDWNVAVHCVNCQGVMGAGLAAAIKERYPAAFDVYRECFEANDLRLGEFTVANVGDGRKIVNIVAQDRYGTDQRHLNYESFYFGMTALRDALEQAHSEGRIYTLGIPHGIGCGLAGGDFNIIDTMIHSLYAGGKTRTLIVEKIHEKEVTKAD